jgi:predicted small integral membrane protein
MRLIKILLVAGMALFLTLAAFGNITMPDVGFGAIKTAVGMQGTFRHPHAMWRAVESPVLIWLMLGVIVLFEIVAGVLCWMGAARMWAGRASSEAFAAGKRTARLGLGVAACLYFIGFLVIADEFFLMWQNSQINVLGDAFRQFASAALIALWLSADD